MGVRLGSNAKLYLVSGDFGDEAYTHIDIVRDMAIDLSNDEFDVTSRASGGVRQFEPILRMMNLEFDILEDPDDDNWQAIRDAYVGRTSLKLCSAAAGSETDPTDGEPVVEAYYKVVGFKEGQSLNGANIRNVVAKPCWFDGAFMEEGPHVFLWGAGVIGFVNASENFSSEADDITATVRVKRVGGTRADSSVDYTFVDDGVTNGDDYVGQNGTLSFGRGDGFKDISFVVKSGADSGAFSIQLDNLVSSDPGENLGTDTVTITLND